MGELMNHRCAIAGGVLGAIFVCGTAAAQETLPPADTGMPTVVTPQPTAEPAPTSAPATATQTSTTTVTSAEPMPYVPAKKSCGLINHDCKGPHFALAIEGGAAAFQEAGPFAFNTGIGSVSSTGPSWGFRVGADLTRWLGVDAHYVGMNNRASGEAIPGGSVSLLTSGFTGELRFTAPIPYVQPYLLTGAGVYTTSITGSNAAQGKSPLFGSTEFGVPLGVGLSIPISDGVSAGGELTYHRFFGESFAGKEEIGGGDLTTMNTVVRARL